MSDTLTEGQKLVRGESLTSNNGAYTLTLQDDGNLVLAFRGTPLWATSTGGKDVVRAEVQSDGNFVLYTADKPVWHSDTKGKKNVRLVLQDDRNLVLYAADGPAWSTKTETDAPPPPAPEAAGEPAAEEA
ncbi:MAG TPA: lectin, partial [Mycobacterium sp.]|nr:lectin [Mycobacterium sp.]